MRISIATINQAHMISAASALAQEGALATIQAAVPTSRLARDGVPPESCMVNLLPGIFDRALGKVSPGTRSRQRTESWHKRMMDRWLSRNIPAADVYLSISSLATHAGPVAQRKGMHWVVDRPCSHILNQNELLREEYALYGKVWPGISQAIIDRELSEYEKADAILVPSSFAVRSFTERGVSPHKIWRIPYGVDLSRFQPGPTPDPARFDVLFAGQLSIRKGLPYLLDAFRMVRHLRKKLTIVGPRQADTEELLSSIDADVEIVGAVPQAKLAEHMSRSHVMVLPSVEEGLALVQAQALACGCPVLATTNTGGEDLFCDGTEGFVVPIRSPEAITLRLQALADDPPLQRRMSLAARERAQTIGGWDVYARRLVVKCEEALSGR